MQPLNYPEILHRLERERARERGRLGTEIRGEQDKGRIDLRVERKRKPPPVSKRLDRGLREMSRWGR